MFFECKVRVSFVKAMAHVAKIIAVECKRNALWRQNKRSYSMIVIQMPKCVVAKISSVCATPEYLAKAMSRLGVTSVLVFDD